MQLQTVDDVGVGVDGGVEVEAGRTNEARESTDYKICLDRFSHNNDKAPSPTSYSPSSRYYHIITLVPWQITGCFFLLVVTG